MHKKGKKTITIGTNDPNKKRVVPKFIINASALKWLLHPAEARKDDFKSFIESMKKIESKTTNTKSKSCGKIKRLREIV